MTRIAIVRAMAEELGRLHDGIHDPSCERHAHLDFGCFIEVSASRYTAAITQAVLAMKIR